MNNLKYHVIDTYSCINIPIERIRGMRKPNYKSKKIQEEVAKAHAEYSRDNSVVPHFQTICPSAMRELAVICKEGDTRYGEYNCYDLDFNQVVSLKKDAIQHLLNHLNLYLSGDRKENHLAKIMWGCMTMIHHDNACKHNHTFIPGSMEKERMYLPSEQEEQYKELQTRRQS